MRENPSELADTGPFRTADGIIHNISYIGNTNGMLRCLHFTDPVIKGNHGRIVNTVILIIRIDFSKSHQFIICHDGNGNLGSKFLGKGWILIKEFLQITLLIFQDHQKTICAELHSLGQLCDGFLGEISGFFNDERTSGDLCHRGGDILLIEVLCINLCHSGRTVSTFLAQSLCKTDTQSRSSASRITCDHQVSASGSLILLKLVQSFLHCTGNLLLKSLDC